MEDLTDDLTIARHISEIIVSCCIVNPHRNPTELYDIALRYAILGVSIEGRRRIFVTGSRAEFYIDPAVTCVGDTDLMFPMEDDIAVFDDSTIESEELVVNETTEVWLLETSGCPKGYVHLRKIFQTYFNWVTRQMEYFTSNNRNTYLCLGSEYDDPFPRKGPALVSPFGIASKTTVDRVLYISLLGWPPVTKSWPTRDRSYAWPCHALISEVLLNGCDLVYVSHRDYKHDDKQWRYSFSRAEVILIRSWTPIQQIVYHLLRYVVKQTIIREWKNDDKVICPYHLKTLMLWACERKSPVWWESNCVLELCSKLLNTLMKWIMKKHCPHYFMPEWNLLDFTMTESRYVDTIETLQIIVNIRNLSEWFRKGYVSYAFNKIKLGNLIRQQALDVYAASNLLDKKFIKVLHEWIVERYSMGLSNTVHFDAMLNQFYSLSWNSKQFIRLISLREFAPDMQCMNLAMASLRLAWNVSRKSESELSYHELLDVLSELVLKLSGQDTWNCQTPYIPPIEQCSKWYFLNGVKLLSTYCKKHSAAFCLWLKTCKRYFKSALGIQDEYSESTHDACHVYLSALYYVSGTNQERTIKHLMEAKKGRSFRNSSKPYNIMNYSTLLFVDEVAHACGFCFLFGHVTRYQNALSAKRITSTTVMFSIAFLISQTNQTASNNCRRLQGKREYYEC